MDGVKRVRTKGGSDLVNNKYHKPPMWGGYAADPSQSTLKHPWEIYHSTVIPDSKYSRSGRRIWDLSWSFLQDSDIFSDLSNIGWKGTSQWSTFNDSVGKKLIDDPDSFFGQVIHKTNGQLPFIFQPDNTDTTNFAIAKFDQNSFNFSQQSPNLYRISLKIREVW